MFDEMPSDALLLTPPDKTTETVYHRMLDDGATLSVRVHPARSLCRITYETPPEHHYANVIEELTVIVSDGVPEFSKRSIRAVGSYMIGHDDILHLHPLLPRVIGAMTAPEDEYLRAALETYVRNTTN